MIRFLSITILFSLFFSACNPETNSSTKTDLGEESNSFEKVSRRDDGSIKTRVNYKDGKKHGISYLYYSDGKSIQLEIPYVNGSKEGVSKKYFENGKLYAETSYVNDTMNGLRKLYYSSGQLKAEIPYANGNIGTQLKEYFKSGKLKTQPTMTYKREGNFLFLDVLPACKERPSFYIGQLIDGEYFDPMEMDLVPVKDGKSTINLDVYTPSYLAMQEVICECKTIQGNRLILSKKISL